MKNFHLDYESNGSGFLPGTGRIGIDTFDNYNSFFLHLDGTGDLTTFQVSLDSTIVHELVHKISSSTIDGNATIPSHLRDNFKEAISSFVADFVAMGYYSGQSVTRNIG